MESSSYPASYWHLIEDGRIQCEPCPRDCKRHEGQCGACFVRMRQDERMILITYGRSSGFCIDPIEKKSLNHFYPGSSVLSFGTAVAGRFSARAFRQTAHTDCDQARKSSALTEWPRSMFDV